MGSTLPRHQPRLEFTIWIPPMGSGPNSAHVVWKRQGAIAGLIGGPAGQLGITSGAGTPSVIYSGRCYQTVTEPVNTLVNGTYRIVPSSVAQCYDLRTGQIYYEIPIADGGSTPVTLHIAWGTGSEVPGAEATQTYSVELISISGNFLYKVNPWTGAVTNISIATTPSLSGTTYYKDNLCLSIQDFGASAGVNRYRLINWTTIGTSTNFATRIGTNTTYARSSLPTLIDFTAGYGANENDITDPNTSGIYQGMCVEGFNLWTGQSIWNATVDLPVTVVHVTLQIMEKLQSQISKVTFGHMIWQQGSLLGRANK